MPRLRSTTTGGTFYLFCFLIFICAKTKSPTKNSKAQHRMEDFLGMNERNGFSWQAHTLTWSKVCVLVRYYTQMVKCCSLASCSCTEFWAVFLHPSLLCHASFLHQRSHWESSKLRLPAACTVLYSSTTTLLLWLLGHINLAGLRSEAGAGITVQKESQAERGGTKDQRNRAPIALKCTSPATEWVFCARPPSSSERGIVNSTRNCLRVACAGSEMALED